MLKPLTFKYLSLLHIPLGKVDVVTLTVFSLTQAYSPGVHVPVCLDGSVIIEHNCLVGISCPLWVGKAAVENSENWSVAVWDCTEPDNIRFDTLDILLSSDIITEKGQGVATSRILGMLSSSGVVTRSVECGVDNDVSAGGCSDESHGNSCEVVTISGSDDVTIYWSRVAWKFIKWFGQCTSFMMVCTLHMLLSSPQFPQSHI